MGKVTGFLEINREMVSRRDPIERVGDYKQVYHNSPDALAQNQGARCMDCGIPFCHTGCPLGNVIPDWNDLTYRGHWEDAITILHSTNNFPEFTGWVCPAPCETACVLGINDDPVTIKQIELSIIEHAWREGWIKAMPPKSRTGRKVAVIGSGPSGLAAAQQLSRAGHSVTVFERADRIGGLLRYGIPDFKLEKWIIDRRIQQMEEEGVVFKTNSNIGIDIPIASIKEEFDAIVLCGGSTKPRDLPILGRELDGVHFAMDFLPQQNKNVAGDEEFATTKINAKGKRVIVIGGGDTGSDCVGTSLRQGALSVHQFELMPKPPAQRTGSMPWPQWPMILRTSTSHEEGEAIGKLQRDWSIGTKNFEGIDGKLTKLNGVRLEWTPTEGGPPKMSDVPDSEFSLDADLVLLAMGFLGPETNGSISELGLELDSRGNVKCDDTYMSSVPGVFAAGDMRRGQSLVVWAISEGRHAARNVDKWLMGHSDLA